MVDCVILSALMSSPFGKSILMVGEAVIASLKVVVTRTTSASFNLSSKSSVTMDITVGAISSILIILIVIRSVFEVLEASVITIPIL